MNAKERRQAVLQALTSADGPLSASTLASRLSVSRQIIVGDVALLRAKGHGIDATPRGYVLHTVEPGLLRTIACVHDEAGMERELLTCVDNGCTVVDVIVEHPLYGQLVGALQLSSRYDVEQFIARSAQASPLSMLTDGIHLHTLCCPDEAAYRRVCQTLRELHILLE